MIDEREKSRIGAAIFMLINENAKTMNASGRTNSSLLQNTEIISHSQEGSDSRLMVLPIIGFCSLWSFMVYFGRGEFTCKMCYILESIFQITNRIMADLYKKG